MAFVREILFQPLSKPLSQRAIATNSFRVSIRGAFGCGGTALVSFIFNRFLAQEGVLKAVLPYVFKTSLYSSITFTAFAAFLTYKGIETDGINDRLSFIAVKSAQTGLIGAAASFALKFMTPNTLNGSLAEYAVSPFLGVGIAGTILKLFLDRQQEKFKSNMG